MVGLSDVVLILSAGASIAVVVTALLVVLQLRQNTRLIEHAAREYRGNVAIAVLEKLTDESFARRRKAMHDASRILAEQGPAAFDDSIADLEARNFAFIYQILGTLTRSEVIEKDLAIRALGRLVVSDWRRFEPIQQHLMERYHQRIGSWDDFRWLAEQAEAYFERLEASVPR